MVRVPLGEDRGWIELHIDGRAELFSSDCPDESIFRFNAEDGEMLSSLASELASMAEAWEEFKRESPEYTNPAKTTGNMYDNQGEEEDDEAQSSPGKRARGSASPAQPELIGMRSNGEPAAPKGGDRSKRVNV